MKKRLHRQNEKQFVLLQINYVHLLLIIIIIVECILAF